MYSCGLARTHFSPATSAVVSSAPNFPRKLSARVLRASSSTTMKPMLCRFREYLGPGFPRPTRSHIEDPAYFLASLAGLASALAGAAAAAPPAAGAAPAAPGEGAAPATGATPSAA